MNRPVKLLTAVLVVVGVVGCGANADPRADAVAGTTSLRIVPGLQEAGAKAEALARDVSAYCAAPTAAGRKRAQRSWGAAHVTWQRTTPAGIGPAMTRRSDTLVDYPADAERVDAFLTGTDRIDAERVRALSSTARGLGGVEWVLFGPTHVAVSSRACEYASVVTNVVRDEVQAVAAAWTEGPEPYAKTLEGAGAPEMTAEEALNMLVGRQISVLQSTVDREIAVAADETSATSRRALLDEGPANDLAVAISARLRGIRDSYTPTPESDTQTLGELLQSRSGETHERLLDQLDSAIAAIEANPGSLSDRSQAQLAALEAAVRPALTTLKTEVVSRLGVTVGFSDNDGDSG